MNTFQQSAGQQSAGSRSSGTGTPAAFDDHELVRMLVEARSRSQAIMREFNIDGGHICLVARRAEQTISDTALRAELLRLLIDLNEFGREAKRRGLLQPTRRKAATEAAEPAENAITRAVPKPAKHCDAASRAFFASLDETEETVPAL